MVPVSDENLQIILGAHDLSKEEEDRRQIRGVAFQLIHDDWDSHEMSWTGDIALLRLDKPVSYSIYVQPICLVKNESELSMIRNIKRGKVSGWGVVDNDDTLPDIANVVDIPILDFYNCFLNDPDIEFLHWNKSFCAGRNDVGPCQGDSGSGLYVQHGKQSYLRGIVSSGVTKNCTETNMVLYSDVTKYLEFIVEATNMSVNEVNAHFVDLYDDKRYKIHLARIPTMSREKLVNKISSENENDDIPMREAEVLHIITKNETENFIKFSRGLIESKFPKLKSLSITVEICDIDKNKTSLFLKREHFKSFKKISSLKIVCIHLKNNSQELFHDLTKLRSLSFNIVLWENELNIIRIVKDSPDLESLRLSNNEIKILPNEPMRYNKKIEKLDLTGNELVELPVDFFKSLANIKELYLAHNQISRISPDLFLLSSYLEKIDLRSNNIVEIPDGLFKNNPKLTYLDISDNKIIKIKQIFSKMKQLSFLLTAANLCYSDYLITKESIKSKSEEILRMCNGYN